MYIRPENDKLSKLAKIEKQNCLNCKYGLEGSNICTKNYLKIKKLSDYVCDYFKEKDDRTTIIKKECGFRRAYKRPESV